MNMKAALYEPAGKTVKRGRRRKKGSRLPSPRQMAQDKKAKWIKTAATLYGKRVKLWYQTIDALWYPSAGQQLLRIVAVHDPRVAAATIASSPSISPSPPRISWRSSPDAGSWRFASVMSNSFGALKILRTASLRRPPAPLR